MADAPKLYAMETVVTGLGSFDQMRPATDAEILRAAAEVLRQRDDDTNGWDVGGSHAAQICDALADKAAGVETRCERCRCLITGTGGTGRCWSCNQLLKEQSNANDR